MGRCVYSLVVALVAMAWVSGAVAATVRYPDCSPEHALLLGDGRCFEGSNTAACGYDGGDCCECTCVDKDSFACGIDGFNCVDPDALCVNLPPMVWQVEMGSGDEGSLIPTSSPTASPTATPTSSQTSLEDAAIGSTGSSSSSSDLSSSTLGIIIALCAVILLAMMLYRYRQKQANAADTSTGYTAGNTADFA